MLNFCQEFERLHVCLECARGLLPKNTSFEVVSFGKLNTSLSFVYPSNTIFTMSQSPYDWSNRVAFVVKHIYDTDNNGYLDLTDFENLALRFTILEHRGKYDNESHMKNKAILVSLWNEIASLADFNKDGQVTVNELKEAIKQVCVGKKFEDFPEPFKCSIQSKFRSIDVDGDDVMSAEEYRIEVINRTTSVTIDEINKCWESLLNEEDRKRGGINLKRYQELWAEFIGSSSENVNGAFLFGPLPLIETN